MSNIKEQMEEIKIDQVESTPATYNKFINAKDADLSKMIPVKSKMCQPMETTYLIGRGPSSSHTIGPTRACHDFLKEYPQSQHFKVTTFGSFTLTGKGHYTFEVYEDELFYNNPAIKCEKNEDNLLDHLELVLRYEYLRYHSNMFLIESELGSILYCSPGGGKFERVDKSEMQYYSKEKPENVNIEEVANITKDIIYGNLLIFDDFQEYGIKNNLTVPQVIYQFDKTAEEYLGTILNAMIDSVNTGLQKEGFLYDNVPQYKGIKRQAKTLFNQAKAIKDQTVGQVLTIQAYATAAVEQSVTRGTVVTAPTLGSSGVCPSILSHYLDVFVPEEMTPNEKLQKISKEERKQLVDALAIGGLISNICYTTFSVSGTHGCQAEIGVASAMAAAMAAFLNVYISSKGQNTVSVKQHWSIIEFAARTAMKCCEGLTCDPVEGYAIDPCIIRNATYAVSAWQIGLRAAYGVKDFYSNLDEQLMANKEIGEKLPQGFCEDSLGGLAKSTGTVRKWKAYKRQQQDTGKEAQEI